MCRPTGREVREGGQAGFTVPSLSGCGREVVR